MIIPKEFSSRTIDFDFSENRVKHKFITQLPLGVFQWLKMKSADTGKPMTKIICDALMQVRQKDFADAQRDEEERLQRRNVSNSDYEIEME